MIHLKHGRPQHPPSPAPRKAPPEHDLDWEFTGAEHRCPECGYRYEDADEDLDFCPECGVPVAFQEE